jgi:hypothetical protein
MAVVPQTEFNVTLPTQDTAVPPNPLVVGELTSIVIEVTPAGGTKTDYTAPLSAGAALGSVQQFLFTGLTPVFVPVPGTTYTADAFVVDATGNSTPSNSVTWTQNAASAPPKAPTGFTVA